MPQKVFHRCRPSNSCWPCCCRRSTGFVRIGCCWDSSITTCCSAGWWNCMNRPDRTTRRRRGKADAIDAEASVRAWIAGTATLTPCSSAPRIWPPTAAPRCAFSPGHSAILLAAPTALRKRPKPLHRGALIKLWSPAPGLVMNPGQYALLQCPVISGATLKSQFAKTIF
jgi:hypothetical protein